MLLCLMLLLSSIVGVFHVAMFDYNLWVGFSSSSYRLLDLSSLLVVYLYLAWA